MNALREFQAGLAATREALLAPGVADPEKGIPHLEHAAEALSRLKQHLRAEAAQLSPATVAELKRDLLEVTALARQAGGFYLRCAVMLESLTGVYTPVGTAAPLSSCPSLSLEG